MSLGHDVLNVIMGSNDADAHTIRDYLKLQLAALHEETEGFCAKRPLGSSNWQEQIAMSLIDAGYEDVGHWDDRTQECNITNWDYYNELMQLAIAAL